MEQTGQEAKKPVLTLELEFVNQIVGYLSKQPYEEVFQLIGKIHQAAQEQLGKVPGGNGEQKTEE